MREHIGQWMHFMQSLSPVYGLPIMLLGLVLMIMGQQFKKVAVPFVFIMVGLAGGVLLVEDRPLQWIIGGAAGVVLAVISRLLDKYAVSVLCGGMGTFLLLGYLETFSWSASMPVPVQWGIAAVGFIAGASLTFVFYREMVITITSFVGALFLISGLNSTLPRWIPTLFSTINSFVNDMPSLAVPLFVGGFTLGGIMLQLAIANEMEAGAA
ncbi:MAG: hypothetical protein HJJLKODD_02036 [Phycisphaerae bacterium]|nr:hypothetical protein [Phycisphaerae bacterium]